MKHTHIFLVVLLCLTWVTSLSAQSKPGLDTSLIPMYGGIEKDVGQKIADAEFVAEAGKLAGSRQKASEEFVKKGWEAFFSKRDLMMAMRRFNQAWLLNPENSDVLWGFGVLSGAMNKIDDSVDFLRQASEKLHDNARILNDLGFSLTIAADLCGDPDESLKMLKEAHGCFARAEKIEPAYEPLYSNWAITLFYARQYAIAWEKVTKAEQLGGKTLNPMFLRDLEAKMPRPRNQQEEEKP